MPLIVITGLPCSGKTKRAMELLNYFQNKFGKNVSIISEIEEISKSDYNRNSYFSDMKNEKIIRSNIKSNVQHLLNPSDVLIIDASNYIKGFRYELYCMSKLYKTPQCTIFCEIPIEHAWLLNTKRSTIDQYDRQVFDELVLRYELPDNKNRWEAPLFNVSFDDELPFQDIYNALYNAKTPVPYQSTQSAPLTPVNYLYDLDKITQEIINEILAAKQLGVETDIKISSCSLKVQSTSNAPKLLQLRRQFITYCKMQQNTIDQIALLFVQYLNKNL